MSLNLGLENEPKRLSRDNIDSLKVVIFIFFLLTEHMHDCILFYVHFRRHKQRIFSRLNGRG